MTPVTITYTYDADLCRYCSVHQFGAAHFECYVAAHYDAEKGRPFGSISVMGFGIGNTAQEAVDHAEAKLAERIIHRYEEHLAKREELASVPDLSLDDFNL